MNKTNGEQNIWKALFAGAAGGLVGALVMTGFQSALSATKQGWDERGDGNPSKSHAPQSDPGTVQAAEWLSEKVAGHQLTKEEKPTAGNAAHYGFGTASGMLYGVLSEYVPAARSGFGTAFGAGLWAVADEVMVPLLHLSESPRNTPPSTHAYALASHLVYGIATDGVSRGVRALL